jgi:hypothetical protein
MGQVEYSTAEREAFQYGRFHDRNPRYNANWRPCI